MENTWASQGAGINSAPATGTLGKSFKFSKPWVPLECKLHEVEIFVCFIHSVHITVPGTHAQ